MPESVFSKLSEDVILNILYKLDDDPRIWARIACVSTKFSALIRTVCCRTKCLQSIPAAVSDLQPSEAAPAAWSSLYKLAVCCPGLLHSGVLLENSDFGLEREIGPDESYREPRAAAETAAGGVEAASSSSCRDREPAVSVPDSVWSLYDDLMYDTLYIDSAAEERPAEVHPEVREAAERNPDVPVSKKRKVSRSHWSHLASGIWNLSREQGNKLLASRFKGDSLYICDWPGCVHVEEKRNYMLFRGIFKNFKQSRVWRTINDGSRSRIDLNCAFCSSNFNLGLAFILPFEAILRVPRRWGAGGSSLRLRKRACLWSLDRLASLHLKLCNNLIKGWDASTVLAVYGI